MESSLSVSRGAAFDLQNPHLPASEAETALFVPSEVSTNTFKTSLCSNHVNRL